MHILIEPWLIYYVSSGVFVQDLQQELEHRKSEMEELLKQLAELGGNQIRSEEEKAELRRQFEERIKFAEAKVRSTST